MSGLLNEIYHYMGLHGYGSWYAFWSGLGSDITEVAILGGMITAYRKVNCNVKGCWRLQWRDYLDADGNPHKWCKKHHPDTPVHKNDHADFLREHELRKANEILKGAK